MNSIKNTAVTGATGFLGQHLVKRLKDEGIEVYAHARDAHKATQLNIGAARTVISDITDSAAMDELVAGADTVVHLVSNFRSASGKPETYRKINVEGTRAALEASERAGVRRFIYCSTIGVHGHVQTTPADEQSPFNPGDLYQETKLEAEMLCREHLGKTSMEIVIVRPASIYGPGDMRMLKMFRMLTKRRFLLLGPCQENFHAVYVSDVVEGIMRALTTPGISGEVFILGGPQYLPLKDYVVAAAEAVGSPPPWLKLPYWPFHAAAVLCEAVCVPFGIEPPLHRRRVRFYRNNRAFNCDKAKNVLGYHQAWTDLAAGLALTVAWYRENGHLPPRRGAEFTSNAE
ncbi:MAG: NAD-dependent epimerase/dehydratase family protein [Aquisalimonadaceae bacterium]